jgi:hypothetical protein
MLVLLETASTSRAKYKQALVIANPSLDKDNEQFLSHLASFS